MVEVSAADPGSLDRLVRDAVDSAWGSFATFDKGDSGGHLEAHFKFELFHRLAERTVEGIGLADEVPGTCTSRLHAEARPQNGINRKADLLICDPTQRMQFNYRPVVLLELKHRLSQKHLQDEIKKAAQYTPHPERLYLISALPSRIGQRDAEVKAASTPLPVTVLSPDWVRGTASTEGAREDRSLAFKEVNEALDAALDEALALYGKTCHNRTHAFYWRNWEHETHKPWTFPCEGDFVAQVYHRLRARVPAPRIRVDVPLDDGTQKTADLVIDFPPEARIAVEVKMNWDQFFEPHQKEAQSILSKLERLRKERTEARSILVVIQGVDAGRPKYRDSAYACLKRTTFRLDLVSYNEEACKTTRIPLGEADRP